MKRAGFGCLILVLTLAGCTTEPAKLTLATPVATSPTASAPATMKQVCLLLVEDQRTNSESLGQVAGRPFHANDLPAWIVQSLNNLAPGKYLISEKVPKDDAHLAIKVCILKAYVSNVLASKTAVIVLKVEYSLKGEANPTPVIVRGQYTGPNWASGTGEVQTALQAALNQCMQQISTQIDASFPKPSKTGMIEAADHRGT
ncbi:MAG: hypothetical protein QM715_00700 [Nibricoccus sp.]